MFSKLFNLQEAGYILDVSDDSVLKDGIARKQLKPAEPAKKSAKFRLGDIILFKLAQVIEHLGVEGEKAYKYADAVLGQRLSAHDRNPVEWIENETQELLCFIEDDQLARIFLRSKTDAKEVEVGAVKPVLFPATRCEINVFRVIRPLVYRARQIFSGK
ncbi:MAG TPA: hypothetical protein VK463_14690 [Desulfomonilaceae bacterium]|nr:hypothetical protein [Desulfomonilaceae bacterium]